MNNIIIDTDRVILNGVALETYGKHGEDMLTSLYKSRAMAYPKYYKMDPLCRLGFIGTELLMQTPGNIDGDTHAIVAIGHSGSIADDTRYMRTIRQPDDFFPSPAVFVYTLANIVTGEIAIRHKIYGETSSYLIESYNPAEIAGLLVTAFDNPHTATVTGGWIDCKSESDFSLRFATIDRETRINDIITFLENNPIH